MKRLFSRRGLALVALAVAVLASSCASSSGGGGGEEQAAGGSAIRPGWQNEVDLEPSSGGTLEVTLMTPPTGLDPNSGTLGLPTQGPVLTAIFDSLMRYDPDTGELTGQLAESITSNDDFTEWTIRLRPDVRFTDGTPLDAEAVVYSIERLSKARNAASTYPAYFTSIETPDDLTVVLGLDEPLNNVDALFAAELGFIVSPTAAEAAGDGFARNPVGAGPFMVQSFSPDQELVLVKNPDYALGEVRLDGVRMTWATDGATNVDKVLTGQSDMSFASVATHVARAIEADLPTYVTLVGGAGMTINSAQGRPFPGNDPRVRRAISMAVDPEQFNERVYEGQGVMGRWLFPPGNRLHVDTPYSVGDLDEAKRLVEEVKAETGWDGTLRLVAGPPEDRALAYQAQLNAGGFTAEVDMQPNLGALIESVLVNRDFDAAIWAMTTYDTNVYQSLSRSLSSESPSNYMSFSSPEMDELLEDLRTTPDDDATRDVLSRIAEVFQAEQPYVYAGTDPYAVITTSEVGGVVPTALGVFLWSEIYKA